MGGDMIRNSPIGDLENHPGETEDELRPHTDLLVPDWTSWGWLFLPLYLIRVQDRLWVDEADEYVMRLINLEINGSESVLPSKNDLGVWGIWCKFDGYVESLSQILDRWRLSETRGRCSKGCLYPRCR